MKIALVLLFAYLATKIPIIGKYISIVNTLIHESGHALFALLTGGGVHSISLFANTEGVATTTASSWIGKVLTSAAGYPFSSITSFFLFFFISKGEYNVSFYILMGFGILNLIFWVRNLYGVTWLISFLLLLYGLTKVQNHDILQMAVLFICGIVLTHSVSSTIDIVRLSWRDSKKAGDCTNLASFTLIPAIVWSLFFFSQAIYFAFLSLKLIYLHL